ncbi:MAG: P-loop containing nucleoside triphosphate hydrolase protein, partial [Olpidium bornovanus]
MQYWYDSFPDLYPQEARVAVPDVRFEWLCAHYKPQSEIPAYLTVIDIAGLVKGASSGEGLGNEFLANIKAVDGLFHVVRAFEDDMIAHVEGSVNPIRDMVRSLAEIIHTELRLKDEEALVRTVADLTKQTDRMPKTSSVREEKLNELKVAKKLLKRVGEENKDVRTGDWTNDEIDFINTLRLLTAKPLIYLVNVSADDYVAGKNKWWDRLGQ